MKFKTWLLAAAMAAACASQALAADPIGYVAPDGVNTVSVTAKTPLPVSVNLIASATFTTPAGTTAYASGQLVANSATAGSVAPLSFTVCRTAGGTGMVRRARLTTADSGFANVTLRLHLYRDAPTVANGDHGTFSSTDSAWLDDVDIILDHAFSDPVQKGIGTPTHGSEINYDCGAALQTIYGLVEARGAITPVGAKALTIVLEALAN